MGGGHDSIAAEGVQLVAGASNDSHVIPSQFSTHLRKARARLHAAYIVARVPQSLKRAIQAAMVMAALMCVAAVTLGLR